MPRIAVEGSERAMSGAVPEKRRAKAEQVPNAVARDSVADHVEQLGRRPGRRQLLRLAIVEITEPLRHPRR